MPNKRRYHWDQKKYPKATGCTASRFEQVAKECQNVGGVQANH